MKPKQRGNVILYIGGTIIAIAFLTILISNTGPTANDALDPVIFIVSAVVFCLFRFLVLGYYDHLYRKNKSESNDLMPGDYGYAEQKYKVKK